MSGRLEGRRAIVVGGGQSAGATLGNGRAAAIAMAREGAHVLVADRDLGAARETVAAIRDEGRRADAHEMDVSREEDCRRLPAAAIELLGGIDVLFNNVGIVAEGDTLSLSLRDWRRSLDVNLTGMWLTCKHVLPVMIEQARGGAIVNNSSMAALMPAAPGAIAYSVTKVGVDTLTRTLALEHAHRGIRVNAVAPGMIDTPLGVDRVAGMRGVDRAEVAAARAATVPMGTQGSAWDIANAVVYLASDDSAYVTGVVLPVDGGSTLVSGPARPPGSGG
jgi:NAD(P)-dependent dehydrogenase (short-subunit alcohol dehydrogenase family)